MLASTNNAQDHNWTTDQNADIKHVRMIDIGSFGQVHEVRPGNTGC